MLVLGMGWLAVACTRNEAPEEAEAGFKQLEEPAVRAPGEAVVVEPGETSPQTPKIQSFLDQNLRPAGPPLTEEPPAVPSAP
jgi:hypothetical protein